MIRGFADQGTEDIYNGQDTKAARRKLPRNLWTLAQRKLSFLHAACDIGDLRSPPGNNLEELKGRHKGRWSIRVNDKYRITFHWTEGNATEVWVGDYHDHL